MEEKRREARGEEYWEPVYKEYESSGEMLEAFCMSRDIRSSTFKNWIYKFRRQQTLGREDFIEIKLPRSNKEEEYRLVVNGGRELIVGGIYDVRRIRELIGVLEMEKGGGRNV